MNPEFLREEHALQDFLNPSRIVVGELDKQSGDTLEKLYSSFKAPIFRTDLDSAEMIKYTANCFLAAKISFFNEVHMICRKLGLDSTFISKVASLDPRIGDYGIYGGRPFSGKCLPKDLEALIHFARTKKINPRLLEAVLEINKEVGSYTVGESGH
jgi:UDPglucose 6-dehydrogenase